MGWTGTRAVYYYKNGTVNRKKECDEYMGTQITVICSGKKYLLTKSVLRGHSTPQWICWPERTKFRVDDIIRLGFEKHRLDTSEMTSA